MTRFLEISWILCNIPGKRVQRIQFEKLIYLWNLDESQGGAGRFRNVLFNMANESKGINCLVWWRRKLGKIKVRLLIPNSRAIFFRKMGIFPQDTSLNVEVWLQQVSELRFMQASTIISRDLYSLLILAKVLQIFIKKTSQDLRNARRLKKKQTIF